MDHIYLRTVGRTDRGRVRKVNEDGFVIADLTGGSLLDGASASSGRFEVRDRGVLLAVSDGVGGSRAGEVASAMVLETITRALAKAPQSTPAETSINLAVEKAHARVRSTGKHEGFRMGATLTAVYVHGASAFVAEVGDSRAYLLRAGRIAQLTHDQSLVQQLLDAGIVSPDNVEHSPFRNLILQAVGHQRPIKVALGRLELRARDCLFLCSDGLTRHVSDGEIRDAILSSPNLTVACDRLIDLANERGGEDNVTVVLGGVGGDLAPVNASADVLERTYQVLQAFS